jgi:uncharacterized protein YvpB
MTNLSTQDFSTPPASAPAALTYEGPKDALINKPVILKGRFDAKRVAKLSLVAEDKYSLNVTTDAGTGTWQVKLDKGFSAAGARWLRLKGVDAAGKTVGNEVIYLTVTTDPLTVGQDLTLKVLKDTLFKAAPVDSATLNSRQKMTVKAGQTFEVNRYGYIDGHLKVELSPPLAPIGDFGCFFAEHVQLSKGTQVFQFKIDDVPTTALSAAMLVTTTTLLKAKIADSSELAANQKAQLLQGQSFQITGYACVSGHFRVVLANPIPGFGDNGYVYWEHVALKQGNKVIGFEPDALTLTIPNDTLIKKRPIDSSKLNPQEKYTLPARSLYGVASYALVDGHVKVSLTEELRGFGNTGYVFPGFVQLRRGGKVFDPMPSQVELNVPYFSQRDNPRLSWATCNVTSIAMVMYYYGVRSKHGGQLEDELLQWCLDRYGQGSQTDNAVLSQLIKAYGFETSFSTTRKWSEVKSELMNGRPVVLGGLFTHGGHIVTVIGFNEQGYLVNDPWGDAISGYTNTEGRRRLYSYAYCDRVAGPDGGVWAHFTRKV